MIILKFCKHWEYTKIMESKERCQGRFCNNGRKCENGLNLSLGSFEVFIMENQAQNSKCIMNKKLIVLWQERIKILITKVQKKHKNITSLKFRPTVTWRRKLREVVRKRGKVPLYPYSPPPPSPNTSKLQELTLVEWA